MRLHVQYKVDKLTSVTIRISMFTHYWKYRHTGQEQTVFFVIC